MLWSDCVSVWWIVCNIYCMNSQQTTTQVQFTPVQNKLVYSELHKKWGFVVAGHEKLKVQTLQPFQTLGKLVHSTLL